MANYGRELRMGEDIRKKGKVEKAIEFVERMKKVYEEARVALKKAQEDMKRQVEGVKEWKVEKILNKRKIRGANKYLV